MSLKTPLHDFHAALGAKFVDFAGYAMPLQFGAGVLAEHRACRSDAALFDVSHMGQIDVAGADGGACLERVVSADIRGLSGGRQRYALLLAEDGGVLDDLMVARRPESPARLRVVANAATKHDDMRIMRAAFSDDAEVMLREDLALLAIQGPKARAAVGARCAPAADMGFMDVLDGVLLGAPALITCSGYTGEDGFELAVPSDAAESVARALLDQPGVAPAGLAARDLLRLEAGMPLYGQDVTHRESPIEADLAFAVSKNRREAGDLRGGARILQELRDGPSRMRIGLALEGRSAARTGARVLIKGEAVGQVTSGAFSPELGHAIAMAMVDARAADHDGLEIDIRGKAAPARRVPLPFRAPRYVRRKPRASA